MMWHDVYVMAIGCPTVPVQVPKGARLPGKRAAMVGILWVGVAAAGCSGDGVGTSMGSAQLSGCHPSRSVRLTGTTGVDIAHTQQPDTIVSRITNFWTLPVTVIGNASTRRICAGTL